MEKNVGMAGKGRPVLGSSEEEPPKHPHQRVRCPACPNHYYLDGGHGVRTRNPKWTLPVVPRWNRWGIVPFGTSAVPKENHTPPTLTELGVLLKSMEKNKGLQGSIVTGSKQEPVRDTRPTLAELGVNKKTSMVAQQAMTMFLNRQEGCYMAAMAAAELKLDAEQQIGAMLKEQEKHKN